MTIGREELLGIAHAERQRLGRMVQFADPSTWAQPSAAAGWWNIDVMAHLAAGDTAAAQLVADEPAEELEEYRAQLGDGPFTVDGWNAWTTARRSGQPEREILETWGRAAEALLIYAAKLTDEEWDANRYAWLAGDIAARYLIQSRVVEWFLHGEDMRATNGVATGWQQGWQHWPVHLTIDMGVRMLPWALAQQGHDLSGRTVRIDVEGAGEGSWHWGLGAGEVPRASASPDATLAGRAPQFALVAGKRLAPDAVLESGAVVLGGDVALADLILRTIRAYP
ncbi:MAG TPA: maleylpyruvate isomerase family mycothiol-dependent enzyme [Actinomycetota bacterium]